MSALKKGPQIPTSVAILIIIVVLAVLGFYAWKWFTYIEPGSAMDTSGIQRPAGGQGSLMSQTGPSPESSGEEGGTEAGDVEEEGGTEAGDVEEEETRD